MKTSLRILHLEDDPRDAQFLKIQLNESGIVCSITRVENRDGFITALQNGDFNLVISDYLIPGFTGLDALRLVQASAPHLPFILVSGAIDDNLAIEILEQGATDYVLKDHLPKLIPVVHRIIKELELRNERLLLEKQFIQAQKMETIGHLAGGVAHDFNNILAVIMGNNDYVMERLLADNPLRKNLEEIRLASKRAAALTQQLLSFSRHEALEPKVIDLNEVISSMDKMLNRLVGESVTLSIALDKKLGVIKINPGYVSQILMNLAINARDAMPHGGRLTVTTCNATLSKKEAGEIPNASPGEFVTLMVRDTGIGMSPEVMAHLFEAFFTTKPQGKGTGLGLATCANIMKQAQAFIKVESEVGRGTTFQVFFPRVNQAVDPSASITKTGVMSGGSETVLVVEDESALRRVVVIALQGQGYTVLQASSGQEGLRVASEQSGTPIDLVISDLVMPQMGGKAMAEWLKSSYPHIKILFTSGYNEQALAHQEKDTTGAAFLAKPYSLSVLTRKVREVLDAQ